jgi:hypothetical protein
MPKSQRFLLTSFLVAVLLVWGVFGSAFAQTISEGKLSGTVMDDQGVPLPGVTLELTSPALMGMRSTVSSARGTYVFLNLPVGTYTLTASLTNFKTLVRENIDISAAISLVIDLTLEVGKIEESVTVLAASPIVDAKSSTVSSTVDSQMLDKLPTSRDAFYDLSLTTPGMFDVASSSSWLPSPTAYGGSSMENVFLVNGVNTTNPRGAAFGSLVSVNYNAVEEVRVVALGSKAEYGSFSGAAIDVLTKSGSNSFHGNLAFYTELLGGFYKSNQPAPGANVGRSWLFIREGDKLSGDTKTNWEGNFTIGGPIVKDRLWFYGAFDYIRADQLPVNWSLLNQWWGRYGDLKITAEPFKNNRAWAAYHYENNKGTGWSWGTEPEWDTSMTYGVASINNTLSAQWQWLPTSTMIFTAKYLGFWTNDEPFIPDDHPDHPGYINWWKWAQYGINGAFPYVESQKSSRQTFQGDVSYYAEDFLGEHDIKFGVQYTRGRGNWMGGYFQNYVNFLYPLPWGYNVASLKAATWYYGGAMYNGLLFYNQKDYLNPFLTVRTADSLGIFIDDQWSIGKRLTLNLGLRFDHMSTKYGVGKVYDFVTSPSEINGPPPVIRDRQSTDDIFDFKTWSPRVGFTYLLTEDAKTVFRASYGRYYMPLAVEFLRRFGPDMPIATRHYQIYSVPWNEVDLNGNGVIDLDWYTLNGQSVNETIEAARQVYGLTPIYEDIRSVDYSWTLNVAPDVRDMYTDQISVNLERELFKDFSVGATYIYKHAKNLYVNVPINRETGLEWEYERVPFTTSTGQQVELYSIKWLDYNGDGVIDPLDIAWVGENTTYRVENMQTYDGIEPQRTYQGLQLVFNKRYSNRWQGLASIVYSWTNGTAQRTMRQSDNMMGPMITDDTWMGTLNYTINNMDGPLPFVPTWEFKISGSYSIPYVELDLGLRYRLHTGRPIWDLETYPVLSQWSQPAGGVISGGLNRIVAGDPKNPDHLPTLSILDLRAEKAIRFGKYGAFHVILDVFNVFNSADVVDADFYLNYGLITGITDARRFRLSFLYEF